MKISNCCGYPEYGGTDCCSSCYEHADFFEEEDEEEEEVKAMNLHDAIGVLYRFTDNYIGDGRLCLTEVAFNAELKRARDIVEEQWEHMI